MDSICIGSKFFGHDASVFCIRPETKELVGIANERITRFKHDDMYPLPALYALVDYLKIDNTEVKEVYFANSFICQRTEKRLSNLFETTTAMRMHHRAMFKGDFDKAMTELGRLNGKERYEALFKTDSGRFLLDQEIRERDRNGVWEETMEATIERYLHMVFPRAKINLRFYDHQLCHAMSIFFTSPFKNREETLYLTMDGCGDDSFSRAYMFDGKELKLVADCPHDYITLDGADFKWREMGSPGGVYHYFTYLLGFQPDADEGKVEALAAFAKPDPELLQELLALFPLDKQARALTLRKELAEKTLNYDRMRQLMTRLSREVMAASVQAFLEEVMLEYTSFLMSTNKAKNLCIAGGVGANVIVNLRVFEEVTPNLYIVPAMADDGTAQGAAILLALERGSSYDQLRWLNDRYLPYYGTSYTKEDVLARLSGLKDSVSYEDLGDNWPERAAEMLVEGKIGAIFHGRMEWGPRALGNRSIIADARRADMRELINREIKRRPLFQPFCPSILLEERERLFEASTVNKHMTCAFRMKPEHISALPSAVHIDGTARVQFVEECDNPNYYRLIRKVKELTGYGVIINTSFNRHGRTIVEAPEDAVRDFLDTDLGFLIIEGVLVRRHNS